MKTAPTRVMTIGSSCINRFQFEFFQSRHPETEPRFIRSVFDWNITSLVGTETVLKLARAGTLQSVLQDRSLYYVDWDVLVFNRKLPGLCLFHEREAAENLHGPGQLDTLIDKLIHQAAPLLGPGYAGRTHLVWSNIQPNLPDTVDNVTPWQDFQITAARLETIKAHAKSVFGVGTTFTFLTLAEDCAKELRDDPDIRLVDLPRGTDFKGPTDLYEPWLTGIISSATS